MEEEDFDYGSGKLITKFQGEYAFLSNFYPCTITYNGLTYQSVEAAFQAQKDISRSKEFTTLSAVEAKHLGKEVQLRSDWKKVRVEIMERLIEIKFKDPILRRHLISTGAKMIIQVDYDEERFWGVYEGIGMNVMGQILMAQRGKIRMELLQQETKSSII